MDLDLLGPRGWNLGIRPIRINRGSCRVDTLLLRAQLMLQGHQVRIDGCQLCGNFVIHGRNFLHRLQILSQPVFIILRLLDLHIRAVQGLLSQLDYFQQGDRSLDRRGNNGRKVLDFQRCAQCRNVLAG